MLTYDDYSPRKAPLSLPPELNRSLEEVARAHFTDVLASCRGNLAKTARILGIDRSTVVRKLRRWQAAQDESRTIAG